jgi:hypothetical protein
MKAQVKSLAAISRSRGTITREDATGRISPYASGWILNDRMRSMCGKVIDVEPYKGYVRPRDRSMGFWMDTKSHWVYAAQWLDFNFSSKRIIVRRPPTSGGRASWVVERIHSSATKTVTTWLATCRSRKIARALRDALEGKPT